MEPRVPKAEIFPQKGSLCWDCPREWHSTATSSHGNGVQMDSTNTGGTFPAHAGEIRSGEALGCAGMQRGRRTRAAGGEQLSKELTDGFLWKRVINILLPAPGFNGMLELKKPSTWKLGNSQSSPAPRDNIHLLLHQGVSTRERSSCTSPELQTRTSCPRENHLPAQGAAFGMKVTLQGCCCCPTAPMTLRGRSCTQTQSTGPDFGVRCSPDPPGCRADPREHSQGTVHTSSKPCSQS